MRSKWPPHTYHVIFRLYVAAMTAAVIVIFSISFTIQHGLVAPLTLMAVGLALVGGEHIKFKIGGTVNSLAAPAQIAACVLLPPPDALALSVMSVSIAQLMARRTWSKRVFNIAHTGVILGLSSAAFAHFAPVGPEASPLTVLTHPLATILLIFIYLICDIPLVHAGLWCVRQGAHRVTAHVLWEGLLPELAAIPIGLLAAIMYQLAPPATLLLVGPLVLLSAAFAASDRYVREQTASIAADARAEEQARRAAFLQEVAHFGPAASLTDPAGLVRAIARSVAVISGASSVEVHAAVLAGTPPARIGGPSIAARHADNTAQPERRNLLDSEHRALGTVTLWGQSLDDDPTRDAALTILLGHATLALANMALHQDVARRATTDTLTDLDNRAGGLAHLHRSIARAERARAHLSLLQIDMDRFKEINDIWGHAAGDAALVAVAAALRALSRDGDVPIRLGGDEFLIVLADTDLVDAHEVADRLCATLNPLRFEYLGRTHEIGASIGVATWGVGMDDTDLLRVVDEAAYAAKKMGKGCVATIEQARILSDVPVPTRDARPAPVVATERPTNSDPTPSPSTRHDTVTARDSIQV